MQHCPVILTDHNHVVLRVLEQNAALNKGSHSIRCMHLDWGGDSDAVANVLLQSPDRQVTPHGLCCTRRLRCLCWLSYTSCRQHSLCMSHPFVSAPQPRGALHLQVLRRDLNCC